jgi:uncharacterized protein YjbJ (UPF0337 family)
MDDQTEVIKGQMQETREALSEKIEALEQQVVGTVQNAATSVAQTVETVTDTVQETVGNVKESVEGAVSSVKDTFNIPLQVRRHPWPMLMGSVAVGFMAARWLEKRPARRRAGLSDLARPAASGNLAPAYQPSGPSFLDKLTTTYRSELDAVKGLVVSAVAGVVRDIITDAVAPTLAPRVSELIDNVTEKLGGKPIRGHILRPQSEDEAEELGLPSAQWQSDAETSPRSPTRGHAGNGGHTTGRERRF